ncbi:MerR family transcriptional regulator [Kaistia granuli]|uniref:MerR family transcriptional regulator n=1 Tax=Kaistia granuli TaxID=363259 RepID=UPI000371B6C9|nr:MerR family transcriptional regulator [Kaistia granuli]
MTELLTEADDERVTARFVRFLVAEGVIPPPRGGRANADYGADHLNGIRRYLSLRGLGLSAARVKEIVAGAADIGIPVLIAPGITLILDPKKLERPLKPEQIAEALKRTLNLIAPEDDTDA